MSNYWNDRVARWESLILEHAQDIDPDLIAAIIRVESSGLPNATSHSGAVGLMQVMPYHQQTFPHRPPASALYDPPTNIEWGVRILGSELEWSNGDLALALGAYYDGRGRAAYPRGQAYAESVLEHYRGAQ